MNPLGVCWLIVAVAFVTATATVAAESSSDVITQLEAAMRTELAQKPPGAATSRRGESETDRRQMLLSHVRPSLSRGLRDERAADEVIAQILVSFESDAVRLAVEKLRETLRSEREANEKALIEQLQRTIGEVSAAIRNAKTAADLDHVVRNASGDRDAQLSTSDAARKLGEHLRQVHGFALRWQEYLAHSTAGRAKPAEQILRDVSGMTAVDVIPRSEILARIAELQGETAQEKTDVPVERLREVMAKTKTLDEIVAALQALRNLQAQGKSPERYDTPVAMLINELSTIQRCLQEYRAGLPSVLHIRGPSGDHTQHRDVVSLAVPLKLELMRLILPRVLEVEEKPAPDEPPDKYVDRMMQLAFERCDARLLSRLQSVRANLNDTQSTPEFSRGLDALLAARNQEDAGQFVPAVVSYQRALRSGGDLVPAKVIGARLTAIQAAHPTEYEAGMQKFLTEPQVEATRMRPPSAGRITVPGAGPAAQPQPAASASPSATQ